MVPAQMIHDFAEEIRTLFADANYQLKDESGHYRIPSVFQHALPPPGKNRSSRIPYVLVALHNGDQPSADSPRAATLHIIGQIFDDTEDMQGYVDGLNMIEMICQHLYGKGIIAGRYEVVYPYQFAVLDDVRYPYFSAGLAIKVEMAGVAPQNITGGYAV